MMIFKLWGKMPSAQNTKEVFSFLLYSCIFYKNKKIIPAINFSTALLR